MENTSELDWHLEDGVLWVTISRYERRNALTTALLRTLVNIAEAALTSRAKILVLRGDNSVFSSGIDTREAPPSNSGPMATYLSARDFRQALADFGSLPLVKIVQLEGYCLGAAVLLASYATVRIAARDTVFALPELDRGVPFSADGMARMIYHFGETRAVDLVLTSRRFSALEAMEAGFLTQIVENDRIADAVTEYVARLCDRGNFLLMQSVLTAQAATRASMRTTSMEFGGELLADVSYDR